MVAGNPAFRLRRAPADLAAIRRLPGRGYPFAKVLGLLLVSYLLWLGASFRLAANTTGGILLALVRVGWAVRVARRRRVCVAATMDAGRLLVWLGENRSLVIATELLFLVVLVGWSVFRAYNPDIAGTEKPMEFAFINGVLGSRFFPPQDPWLSGYGISYYYFGYVMLASLCASPAFCPRSASIWASPCGTPCHDLRFRRCLHPGSPLAPSHRSQSPPEDDSDLPGRSLFEFG